MRGRGYKLIPATDQNGEERKKRARNRSRPGNKLDPTTHTHTPVGFGVWAEVEWGETREVSAHPFILERAPCDYRAHTCRRFQWCGGSRQKGGMTNVTSPSMKNNVHTTSLKSKGCGSQQRRWRQETGEEWKINIIN